jgi:hypothetical protein
MAMAMVFGASQLAPASFAQQGGAQAQKWEYKIVNYCDPENLGVDNRQYIQQLGEEGWELVSSETQMVNETTKCLVQYFKRPKGPEPRQVMTRHPQCSIPTDKAPAIRGVRLGMDANELLSLLAPRDNLKLRIETTINNASLAPNYGLATFTLSPGEASMMEVKEKFAGINFFNFTTFDGRVVEINVNYARRSPDLYPSWTIDEWTAKLSSAFNLPGPQLWEPLPNNDQRNLKCKGFEVEAVVNPPVILPLPALGIYRTPSLTIIDPSYRQGLDQRVKSDQELKQREFVF